MTPLVRNSIDTLLSLLESEGYQYLLCTLSPDNNLDYDYGGHSLTLTGMATVASMAIQNKLVLEDKED